MGLILLTTVGIIILGIITIVQIAKTRHFLFNRIWRGRIFFVVVCMIQSVLAVFFSEMQFGTLVSEKMSYLMYAASAPSYYTCHAMISTYPGALMMSSRKHALEIYSKRPNRGPTSISAIIGAIVLVVTSVFPLLNQFNALPLPSGVNYYHYSYWALIQKAIGVATMIGNEIFTLIQAIRFKKNVLNVRTSHRLIGITIGNAIATLLIALFSAVTTLVHMGYTEFETDVSYDTAMLVSSFVIALSSNYHSVQVLITLILRPILTLTKNPLYSYEGKKMSGIAGSSQEMQDLASGATSDSNRDAGRLVVKPTPPPPLVTETPKVADRTDGLIFDFSHASTPEELNRIIQTSLNNYQNERKKRPIPPPSQLASSTITSALTTTPPITNRSHLVQSMTADAM
ncbi:hypothetical protein BLNAU_1701 [Blattamonas nauphoetae]|uniref:Integral membrane protein n=1 Tax=Blattamonas nauphoetae TaxID=2049346 RepID=A0ABQ9YHD3_9EUKA|nr:hypothetical protein BLNAU_1701 [Blattamonas nauphoetae]